MVPIGNRNAVYMQLNAGKLELSSRKSGISIDLYFSDILQKKSKIPETSPEGLIIIFSTF